MVGSEEYEGDWVDDQMHGEGTYKFTSGNVYSGNWVKGTMHGFGKMVYSDGSTYEGNWHNNLMHGEGIYLDTDRITWTGIFVEGTYDSKIQKKLQAEKIIKDKINIYQVKARVFIDQFTEAFSKSDKKTFKDNLTPFFGHNDSCIDFLNVPSFPKFEDRPVEKWNEIIKAMGDQNAPTHKFRAIG